MKYNLLIAQTGLKKDDIDFMKTELAKGGVSVEHSKNVLSVREVMKYLKEINNDGTPLYNVLIIQQCLDSPNRSVDVDDLRKMKKQVPGLKILLCVAGETRGGTYLQEVFRAGIYTAFFAENGTMSFIADLILRGRSAEVAVEYYGIPEDREELKKQIGYIEGPRLRTLINYIKQAKTEEELSEALKHLVSGKKPEPMLSRKEFLYLLTKLDEEDVNRIFPMEKMGIYFDRPGYQEALEKSENGGFFSRFRKVEVNPSDFLITHEVLEARELKILAKQRAALAEKETGEESESNLEDTIINETTENLANEMKEIEKEGNAEYVIADTSTKIDMMPESEEVKEPDKETAESGTGEIEEITESVQEQEKIQEEVQEITSQSSEKGEAISELDAMKVLFGDNITPEMMQAMKKMMSAVTSDTTHVETPETTQETVEEESVQNTTKELVQPGNNTVETQDSITEMAQEETAPKQKTEEKPQYIEEVTPQVQQNVVEKTEIQQEQDNNVEKDKKPVELNLKDIPINMSSMQIKSEKKLGDKFYVAAGSKHPGVTFIASVMAHSYKHKYPNKKVCVYSFEGHIDDFKCLSNSAEEKELNHITIKGVDYMVGRRSDINLMRLQYDAVFIDTKNLRQIGKDERKEKVFLVTQGTETHYPMLKKSCEFMHEVGFSDVELVVSSHEIESEELERLIKKALRWKADIHNIGHLHSPIRTMNKFEELF